MKQTSLKSNSLRCAFIAAAASVTLLSSSHAAVVVWSANAFDADSDISTQGTLVKAVNLGSTTGVTVNGVLFAGEASISSSADAVSSLFTTTARDFTLSTVYQGGAIGSLTSVNAQTLLDSVEFASGNGNSLARLTSLTIGQQYQVQLLIVDDRTTGVSVSLGHANPSGSVTETYTLSGQDISNIAPKVFTGTFTADQTSQDLHVSFSGASNGEVNAFQLRAIPEPRAALLGGLGLLALLRRRRN